MASVNLTLPQLKMEDFEDDAKLQKILSYLYQLNEQLRYELTHIDDDNISGEGISEASFTDSVARTLTNDQGEVLQLYMSARKMLLELSSKVEINSDDLETVIESLMEIETTAEKLKIQVGEKTVKEQIDEGIDAIETFENTAVEITPQGFHVKSTGTFTVESQKFDIDENGEMSAVNCRLSGDLSVDGNAVWHAGNMIVSTAQPINPEAGLLWVKPDMTAIPAAGTWTKNALTSRPNFVRYYNEELTGVSIGAAPSNAKYRYKVKIPIYHTWNDENAYTCTVYLGSSSGSETINLGAQTFSKGGGHVFEAEVESTVWLGNLSTIWLRVVFSAGGVMTLNSHATFSCTLTAISTSATGWKTCEVQMYTG